MILYIQAKEGELMKLLNTWFAGTCTCTPNCKGHQAQHLMTEVEYRHHIEDEAVVRVPTPQCFVCRDEGTVFVIRKDWITWQWSDNRPLIQDLFPYLAPEYREQMITGTHPNCFRSLFGDEEE